MRIEFLLEEQSMAFFLEELLPRILPPQYQLNVNYFLRPHNGKSDLLKSIPRKVKAFSNVNYETVKIVVLHDQDSNDCIKLKSKLKTICEESGTCPVLIRIVCRELEAWHLGCFDGLEKVYPRLKGSIHRNKAKFRNPDSCHASDELRRIVPEFKKSDTARQMGKIIDINSNKSDSFQQFISGLSKFLHQ